jgi:uncharacterized protein HemX
MSDLAVILGALLALILGVLGFGQVQKRAGRKEAEDERTEETLEGFEAGQDAKRNRPYDPTDAVRRNDGQW